MGLGEHGHILPLLSIVTELLYELLHLWIIDMLKGFLDGEWHACVVYILGCEAEVYKLLERLEIAMCHLAFCIEGVELLLNEVFDSLHIMVCHLLDVLDTLCVGYGECLVDGAQHREEGMVERCELWEGELT